jgi:hypothetical protein
MMDYEPALTSKADIGPPEAAFETSRTARLNVNAWPVATRDFKTWVQIADINDFSPDLSKSGVKRFQESIRAPFGPQTGPKLGRYLTRRLRANIRNFYYTGARLLTTFLNPILKESVPLSPYEEDDCSNCNGCQIMTGNATSSIIIHGIRYMPAKELMPDFDDHHIDEIPVLEVSFFEPLIAFQSGEAVQWAHKQAKRMTDDCKKDIECNSAFGDRSIKGTRVEDLMDLESTIGTAKDPVAAISIALNYMIIGILRTFADKIEPTETQKKYSNGVMRASIIPFSVDLCDLIGGVFPEENFMERINWQRIKPASAALAMECAVNALAAAKQREAILKTSVFGWNWSIGGGLINAMQALALHKDEFPAKMQPERTHFAAGVAYAVLENIAVSYSMFVSGKLYSDLEREHTPVSARTVETLEAGVPVLVWLLHRFIKTGVLASPMEVKGVERVEGPKGFACSHCSCVSGRGTAPTKMLLCGACKAVAFCSSACQKAAWPRHKRICASEKEALAAAAAVATTTCGAGGLTTGGAGTSAVPVSTRGGTSTVATEETTAPTTTAPVPTSDPSEATTLASSDADADPGPSSGASPTSATIRSTARIAPKKASLYADDDLMTT